MKWFNSLTAQEKKLIKLGVIILVPVMLWKFIYWPITHTYESKQAQLINLHKQYKEMESFKTLFKVQEKLGKKFHRDLNQPFIAWIDEQLTKNDLVQFVVRSEPKDNQTLILSFENVMFDELVIWLESLENNYSIKISEVDINLTDKDNGLCNVRITLEEH